MLDTEKEAGPHPRQLCIIVFWGATVETTAEWSKLIAQRFPVLSTHTKETLL